MGRGHTPWGYKEVFIGCHGYFKAIWGLQITILCSKYISYIFRKKIPTLNHVMFPSLLFTTSIITFSISGHINMQYVVLTNVIADSSSRNCVVKV